MSPPYLFTLLMGKVAGRVLRDRNNRLGFAYDSAWSDADAAETGDRPVPLSLSMLPGALEHGHKTIEAFLWGLLPDNATVLDRWAKRFQVSARSPFALIAHVGEDCAGAVQFVREERLQDVLAPDASEIAWLDEGELGDRLRALREDEAAWRGPRDVGQFSLAGAQAKTALLFLGGRWGVPSGRIGTTHILKPPLATFDGHVENEHLCLSLARALGLPAARSEVRRFAGEAAIVIERYDRVATATMAGMADLARTQPVLRLHQEDMCQALALPPTAKYQSEGGPGPSRIVELLRTYSSRPDEDVSTFVEALAYNWLIAGTDGHAKNYSVLHGGGGRVRLAPLYDLASALPYQGLDQERLELAMKVGDKYRLRHIGRADWEKLAHQVGRTPIETIEQVANLAARLPEKVALVRDRMLADGLTHPIIDRLSALLAERAKHCLGALRG